MWKEKKHIDYWKTRKQTNLLVNFKEIPVESSLDYVLGYAKCLFLYENN